MSIIFLLDSMKRCSLDGGLVRGGIMLPASVREDDGSLRRSSAPVRLVDPGGPAAACFALDSADKNTSILQLGPNRPSVPEMRLRLNGKVVTLSSVVQRSRKDSAPRVPVEAGALPAGPPDELPRQLTQVLDEQGVVGPVPERSGVIGRRTINSLKAQLALSPSFSPTLAPSPAPSLTPSTPTALFTPEEVTPTTKRTPKAVRFRFPVEEIPLAAGPESPHSMSPVSAPAPSPSFSSSTPGNAPAPPATDPLPVPAVPLITTTPNQSPPRLCGPGINLRHLARKRSSTSAGVPLMPPSAAL